MKLSQAVKLYKQEERVPVNAYSWYRRSAKECGYVHIGYRKVPAFKVKGLWHVDEKAFKAASNIHRKKIERIKQNTIDHKKEIIHGKNGATIHTEWGGYTIHGNFRFEWSDYERLRMRSDGMWYCNNCNRIAETEHKKEECHLCSDWNGCGRDCTLSKVYCKKCGEALKI